MSNADAQSEATSSINAVNDRAPLPFPNQLPTQNLTQNLRCQVAVGFKHIVGHIRVAHKYAVMDWPRACDQAKVPEAYLSARLSARLDGLDGALTPFLPGRRPGGAIFIDPFSTAPFAPAPLRHDVLARAEAVCARLLAIAPGTDVPRFLAGLVDEIEADARSARLLPPPDDHYPAGSSSLGEGALGGGRIDWQWSWANDDWFRWDEAAGMWFGEHHGWWSKDRVL